MKINSRQSDFLENLFYSRQKLAQRADLLIFAILFFGFSLTVYQIGIPKEPNVKFWVGVLLRQIPRIAMILYFMKWVINTFLRKEIKILERLYFNDLIFAAILLLFNIVKRNHWLLESEWFLYLIISVFFVVRLLREGSNLKAKYLSPSVLFVFSFVMLIFVGTALLLVPVATNGNLPFIDALFTATSAVCVTGLATVDTSIKFTELGQYMILVLIQVGGLGLMTFTNFFAILFRGGMSFKNHLLLSNIIETDKPNSLFKTLLKIVIFTLLVEFCGALLIDFFVSDELFTHSRQNMMFNIFHSVSAFCNAGFSNLPDGLYNPAVRFNYGLQLVICGLIILGGIGFPVVIEIYESIKVFSKSALRTILFGDRLKFKARSYSVHSRVVLRTTAGLLIIGAFLYYVTEYNNTLKDHPSFFGKVVQSIFGSVTPRTAGFNTVNMGELMQGTILIYLLLMWIGASPSSTGGGIKTTTFAIAMSNIAALAKGKNRVDLFKRQISNTSIHRAFAVIFLSLLIIGLAVFLISIFDPKVGLSPIAFECFSAYSTVGLSLNLTPQLSDPSKIVLIVTMFLGRVGMFTLLFGLFTKVECETHSYPEENVLIT